MHCVIYAIFYIPCMLHMPHMLYAFVHTIYCIHAVLCVLCTRLYVVCASCCQPCYILWYMLCLIYCRLCCLLQTRLYVIEHVWDTLLTVYSVEFLSSAGEESSGGKERLLCMAAGLFENTFYLLIVSHV